MNSDKPHKPWQFQPGQSGNPGGRPPLSQEERQMRENFRRAFAMVGNKSIEEIKAIIEDPKQPAAYVLAARAMDFALTKGHPAMYREIFDRTLGKPVQEIDLTQREYNPTDPRYRDKLMEFLQNSRTAQGIKISDDPVDGTGESSKNGAE